MSNVIRFNPARNRQRAIRDKACECVVKLSSGASGKDLQNIHAWLDENPEHVTALLQVARLWDQSSVLSELSDVFPLEEYLPRPVRTKRLVYSAVAALVLAIGLQGSFMGWMNDTWLDRGRGIFQLGYETRIGEQSTVILPDGSEVLLNTNSRIDVDFSALSRDIILHRGEGHFAVASDKDRPFRVHANGGVVEAVGTAFTVQQTLEEGLEVTVIEGEVNFTRTRQADTAAAAGESQAVAPVPTESGTSATTESISLIAGEFVVVDEADETVQKETIGVDELASRLAWRDGMLLFEGESLEKVIREVSRYTSIRIDVDEAVRDIPVLAFFRAGDIEGIMLTMRETFNIKVERLSADHIVLTAEDK